MSGPGRKGTSSLLVSLSSFIVRNHNFVLPIAAHDSVRRRLSFLERFSSKFPLAVPHFC
jgi:hypothetical protein